MEINTSVKSNKRASGSDFPRKIDRLGRTLMLCENSRPGGKWWKEKLCNTWSLVDPNTVSVLCWKCTTLITDPPVSQKTVEKSDKPKGWRMMKEFVSSDGTVYHKGIEQPDLKGTLPVTVVAVKEKPKKLTKSEKDQRVNELGKEIQSLKAALFSQLTKTKRSQINQNLKKANKELKKLI